MQIVSGCSLVVSVSLWGSSSGHLSVQLNSCAHATPTLTIHTFYILSYTKLGWFGKLESGIPISPRTRGLLMHYLVTTHKHTHRTVLWPSWILSRTTQVSQHQKGKTSEVKRIWIYWSKRQWVAVASGGPYANLHLDITTSASHLLVTNQHKNFTFLLIWFSSFLL